MHSKLERYYTNLTKNEFLGRPNFSPYFNMKLMTYKYF